MRSREEIEIEAKASSYEIRTLRNTLEVLLDIRDLLAIREQSESVARKEKE